MQSDGSKSRFNPPISMIAKTDQIGGFLHLPSHPCAARIRFYEDGLVMDDFLEGGVRPWRYGAERVLRTWQAAWSNDH